MSTDGATPQLRWQVCTNAYFKLQVISRAIWRRQCNITKQSQNLAPTILYLLTQAKNILKMSMPMTADYFHTLSPGPSVAHCYTHPEKVMQRFRKTSIHCKWMKRWGRTRNAGPAKRDDRFRLASSSDMNRNAGNGA